MLTKYKSQEEFFGAVSESLGGAEVDDDLRKAILDGVRQADDALGEWEGREDPGLELRLGRWFIRNDDLPFFQLLGSAATALTGAAASDGMDVSKLVGPISSFAAACWQVWRKGAKLTAEQVNVLSIISTHDGLNVEEIMAKLAALKRPMSADKVRGTLKSLTHLELYDGSEVAIVRLEDGEKWRAA
jgi:hypothetical protein